MSCFTIAAADGLARIFPEARFVHSVRDGRDSGSSKVSLRQKPHHPTDVVSGIEFWADRLRQAEEGVRGLSEADRARLQVISLDELVQSDREATYAELLGFLGVADEPAMREFFDTEMNADAAHRERWRKGLERGRAGGDRRALRARRSSGSRPRTTTARRCCAAPTSARSTAYGLERAPRGRRAPADPVHDLERHRARPPDPLDGDRPAARRRGRAALPHPLGGGAGGRADGLRGRVRRPPTRPRPPATTTAGRAACAPACGR